MRINNIYKLLPSARMAEVFEKILDKKGVEIERITSLGQTTPEGEWLKEKKAEWVILLRGGARLRFKGRKAVRLGPGDYVFIPSGAAHRVEWTSPKEKCVWVAVYF